MQLRIDSLNRHLNQQVAPCYLVTGDETLLVQEAADTIRAAARAAGCHERERIAIDGKDDWQQLLHSSSNLSLFAERKLIEVHLPNGKPGTEGSKALQEYLSTDNDDVLLLISGKIDKKSMQAKWFKAFDQRGAVLTIWPVKLHELPGWIDQRLKAAGMRADREALQMLAERVEGNLLAAAQEVEKLKLLSNGDTITADTVRSAVLDNARFDPFELVDTALAGDARHALRTARGLRAEGSPPQVILWALHKEVRLLSRLREAVDNGAPPDRALQQAGVWRSRMRVVQSALQRHRRSTLHRLEIMALRVDGAGKGYAPGDPWDYINDLLLLLAQGDAADRQRA